MPTTTNTTLPQEWQDDINYRYGDQVYYDRVIYYNIYDNNFNHIPGNNTDYWLPLDIYKKDETRMPHGHYSGDESVWDRDNFVITPGGWVLINNEWTGINVRGPGGNVEVHWEDLTELQRAALKGPQGERGEKGEQGLQGPQGEPGAVILDQAQIDLLKGDRGKSNYEIWLETGHTGTETDYLLWLQEGAHPIDDHLSLVSVNPVQNRVITYDLDVYKAQLEETVRMLTARIVSLENRLKAVYNNEIHEFKFGITTEGEYGYIPKDTSNVIPFNLKDDTTLSTMFTEENIGISQQSIGLHDSLTAVTIADNDPYRPTSLLGSPSRRISEDTIQDYGSDVDAVDFDTYVNANIRYTEIFSNGEWVEEEPIYAYGLDGMTDKETCLQSNYSRDNEGVFLNNIGEITEKVIFTIQPTHSGETINYQIGSLNESVSNLNRVREFIAALDEDPSTNPAQYGIIGYKQGSVSSSDTIYIEVPFEKGCYLISTAKCSYKVTKITYM